MTPKMRPDRLATETDVVASYRTFLDRAPESREVVVGALADNPDVWTLIQRFAGSPEAQRRQTQAVFDRISREQDSGGVALAAGPEDMARLIRHIEQVWSQYGKTDAYFSVLTHPDYLMERITGEAIESFYATGPETVAQFQAVCRRNQVDIDPSSSVLELGCGVGRLGEAFRTICAAYIGIDISEEHLHIAENRFRLRQIGGISLHGLKSFLGAPIRYDLFYSFLVLQHNPPPIIYSLLDTCLERINPGGYAYFQVPCFLYDYRFEAKAYLAGEGRKSEMEMHALPQRHIFDLLHKHGLTPIEVTPDPHIGPIGFSYTFFARKAVGAIDGKAPLKTQV